MVDVATRVKLLLAESGLTQSELARRAGVSQSLLSRVVNGRIQGMRPTTRARLMRSLEALVSAPADVEGRGPGVESLGWALQHVRAMRDTDLLPMPMEFGYLGAAWDRVALPALVSMDLDRYTPSPPRSFLVKKDRGGYRLSTQLDPVDTVLFAAMVHDIAPQLEASACRRASRALIVSGSMRARSTPAGNSTRRTRGTASARARRRWPRRRGSPTFSSWTCPD